MTNPNDAKALQLKYVIQPWLANMTWKQQTACLCALRGCDGVSRHDPSKRFIRRLRGAILHNADEKAPAFMDTDSYSIEDAKEFIKDCEQYPLHFVMHIAEAAKIIGFHHPDPDESKFWKTVYRQFCYALHVNPESQAQNDKRLKTVLQKAQLLDAIEKSKNESKNPDGYIQSCCHRPVIIERNNCTPDEWRFICKLHSLDPDKTNYFRINADSIEYFTSNDIEPLPKPASPTDSLFILTRVKDNQIETLSFYADMETAKAQMSYQFIESIRLGNNNDNQDIGNTVAYIVTNPETPQESRTDWEIKEVKLAELPPEICNQFAKSAGKPATDSELNNDTQSAHKPTLYVLTGAIDNEPIVPKVFDDMQIARAAMQRAFAKAAHLILPDGSIDEDQLEERLKVHDDTAQMGYDAAYLKERGLSYAWWIFTTNVDNKIPE